MSEIRQARVVRVREIGFSSWRVSGMVLTTDAGAKEAHCLDAHAMQEKRENSLIITSARAQTKTVEEPLRGLLFYWHLGLSHTLHVVKRRMYDST